MTAHNCPQMPKMVYDRKQLLTDRNNHPHLQNAGATSFGLLSHPTLIPTYLTDTPWTSNNERIRQKTTQQQQHRTPTRWPQNKDTPLRQANNTSVTHFGYLWGYPILWISEPWRYPIPEWYDLHTIPSYHGMGVTYHSTSYHTIPFHHIPYHPTSYHTILPHTIPYHLIPYHHSKPVTGWLGSFLQNMKLFSAGCNTGPLGSIFCGQVLQMSTIILSYNWRLYDECDPFKISLIELYPRFWLFTLEIIHHKPLKLYILEGCLINTIFIADKSILHPPQWYGLWEGEKVRHLCIGYQSWTMQDFIHWIGGKFSPITTQGKHAFFK